MQRLVRYAWVSLLIACSPSREHPSLPNSTPISNVQTAPSVAVPQSVHTAPSSQTRKDERTVPSSTPVADRAPAPAFAASPTWPLPFTTQGTVESRFAPPKGFHRAPVDPHSFAAFLRRLPLAPPGTKVASYTGSEILAGDDSRLAAVANIDIGKGDLQQCADSVMRLHAEWHWAEGHPDVTYPAAAGTPLGFGAWKAGTRWQVIGNRLDVGPTAKADASYLSFRRYLDFVFAWSNTVALERMHGADERPAPLELRGGDFLVMGGNPGHAVVLVDIVTDDAVPPHRLALIGQGYMPAQNFHLVQVGGSPWFSLDGTEVATPFWRPFPLASARRLP